MAVWVEELRVDNFKICLREAKIFDGPHKNIKIVSKLAFVFHSCIPCQSIQPLFPSQQNLGACMYLVSYDAARYSGGQPNYIIYYTLQKKKKSTSLLSIFKLLKKLCSFLQSIRRFIYFILLASPTHKNKDINKDINDAN